MPAICHVGTSPIICWLDVLLVALTAGYGWSAGCALFLLFSGALARARNRGA